MLLAICLSTFLKEAMVLFAWTFGPVGQARMPQSLPIASFCSRLQLNTKVGSAVRRLHNAIKPTVATVLHHNFLLARGLGGTHTFAT